FNVRTVGAGPQGTGGSLNGGASLGNGGGVGAPGDSTFHEERYTVGLDARYRIGAFGLDPTVSYQWGSYDTLGLRTNGPTGKLVGEASAWLFDVIASYQLGPLLLEMRGMYTTGNNARDNLSRSKRYYEPLDLDTGYFSGGWLGILGLGIDYFNGGGGSNQSMGPKISQPPHA